MTYLLYDANSIGIAKLFESIKEIYAFWQIYKQHIQELLDKQKIVED